MNPSSTNTLRRYLHRLANIGILICLCVLGGMLLDRYVLNPEMREIAVGDQVDLGPGTVMGSRGLILMSIKSDCKPCEQAIPFYLRLISTASEFEKYAVTAPSDPVTEDTRQLFANAGVHFTDKDVRKLGIKGSPMLIYFSPDGRVQRVWTGAPSLITQNQILETLGLPFTDYYVNPLDLKATNLQAQTYQVVDARTRESFSNVHFAGAKNIPLDEIKVRAINELEPDHPVAIYGASDKDSEYALELLIAQGFSSAHILRDPLPK